MTALVILAALALAAYAVEQRRLRGAAEREAARDTDSQPTLPTLDQWNALRDALGLTDEMDAEVLRLNLRKGEPGEAVLDLLGEETA